jgi:hypothetical protein
MRRVRMILTVRRWYRRLFVLLSALSLLFCVATVVLWIWSHSVTEMWIRHTVYSSTGENISDHFDRPAPNTMLRTQAISINSGFWAWSREDFIGMEPRGLHR